MNKEKFLKTLHDKLSILENNEIDDIISEYEDHINQKIKDGISEDVAIKAFGDIDVLAKEILSSYKISNNYNSSNWFSYIEEFMRQMGEGIERFCKKISNDKNIDIVKVISIILVGIILILLINIPIDIIYWIGKSIFMVGVSSSSLIVIWTIIINLIRVFIIIAIIYGVWKNINNDNSIYETYMKHKKEFESESKKEDYKKKYKDNWEKKYEEDLKKNYKDKYKKEVKDETIKVVKKEETSPGTFALMIFLKILLIFISIPFIFSLMGLIIAIAILIGLMIKGVFLIGITIIIFGMIFINSAILDALYKTIGGIK